MKRRRRVFLPADDEPPAAVLSPPPPAPAPAPQPPSPPKRGLVEYDCSDDSDDDAAKPAAAPAAPGPESVAQADGVEKATEGSEVEDGPRAIAPHIGACVAALASHVDACLTYYKQLMMSSLTPTCVECVCALAAVAGALSSLGEDCEWVASPSAGFCDHDAAVLVQAAWFRCQRCYLEVERVTSGHGEGLEGLNVPMPTELAAAFGVAAVAPEPPPPDNSPAPQWSAIWNGDSQAYYYANTATVRCYLLPSSVVAVLVFHPTVLLYRTSYSHLRPALVLVVCVPHTPG